MTKTSSGVRWGGCFGGIRRNSSPAGASSSSAEQETTTSSRRALNTQPSKSNSFQVPNRGNTASAELNKPTPPVKSLQGELERLQTQLKAEKAAVQRLNAKLELEQQRAAVELTRVRKDLEEEKSKFKASAKLQKGLQRSNNQLKEELDRTKTILEVYENYRRLICEEQSRSGIIRFKKHDDSLVVKGINSVDEESSRTARYGTVYNSKLDKKAVVVGILDKKRQQHYFNEKVDILTRVRHPNLVSYIGGYEKGHALFSEHLPNGTLLQRRLVDKPPFSWEERVRISATICSTLLFLHNTKPVPIIHGDLRAENIHFDASYVCKLGVFGMSTRSMVKHTEKNSTTAPSIKSDIWDFGIVLLQIVTGQTKHDSVRKNVKRDMGDVSEFQKKDIASQKEVLTDNKIVDSRLRKWPIVGAVKMLLFGLRCSDPDEDQRPDLAPDVWSEIQSISKIRGTPGG